MKIKLIFLLILIGCPFILIANTPTPTVTPGIFYIYTSLDIFINDSVSVTSTTGSYTWVNNWGTNVVPNVSLSDGPMEAYDVIVKVTSNFIIVTIVDKNGNAVNCSETPAIVNIRVYRNRSSFMW